MPYVTRDKYGCHDHTHNFHIEHSHYSRQCPYCYPKEQYSSSPSPEEMADAGAGFFLFVFQLIGLMFRAVKFAAVGLYELVCFIRSRRHLQ